MNSKTIIICVIIVLTFAAVSMAGSDRKIGTAGAQELRIPIGSRGTALGGAIGADVVGAEAIFYNPAGVALIDGTEAMFCNLQYFADMDLNFFGVTKAFEDFGSIGVSAKVLSIGDIVKTTETASTVDGTGDVYSPALSVIGLTYSRILTDRVTFGVTGMYINESIDLVSASGLAFDFGINYDTKWRGLSLGIVLKNIGPGMTFEGAGFDRDVPAPGQNSVVSPNKTFRAQSVQFELPSYIQLSGAMDFLNVEQSRATFYGTFESNSFSKDLYRLGAEYAFDEKYFLRAGYTVDQDQEDYLYGMAFGAGVVLKLGETNVTFEYSWNETEFFDNNQYFTGKINF
nr:PorV/PorQ family protein [candidate division Zixibacteria bacterium]